MSVDKLVDSTQLDADLTSVANAIRAKSGGSGQLAFPAGFVSEIGNISSGYTLDQFAVNNQITGDIVLTARPTRAYAFGSLTGITGLTINAPSGATVTYVFTACTNLTYVIDNYTEEFGNYYFYNCTKLASVTANNMKHVSKYAFYGTKLSKAIFPKSTSVWSYALGSCTSLTMVDIAKAYTATSNTIEQNAFNGSTKLKKLVLRHNAVAKLNGINAFTNTPFASGKSGGTLYVPAAKLSDYQAASNWSTILGYATNTIKSIESTATDPNEPYDLTTHYVDGTEIPT